MPALRLNPLAPLMIYSRSLNVTLCATFLPLLLVAYPIYAGSDTYTKIDGGNVIIHGDNNYVSLLRDKHNAEPPGQVELSVSFFCYDPTGPFNLPPYNRGENVVQNLVSDGKTWIIPNGVPPDWRFGKIFDADDIYSSGTKFNTVCDIRLLNNSSKTISIDELIFDVTESKPDNAPMVIPGVSMDQGYCRMYIKNIGSTPISGGSMNFRLCKTRDEALKCCNEAAWAQTVGFNQLNSGLEINLANPLKRDGVDPSFIMESGRKWYIGKLSDAALTKLSKSRGPYADNAFCATELLVQGKYGQDSIQSKYRYVAQIPLEIPEGMGAAMLAAEDVKMVNLDTDGRNYVRSFPIATMEKSGDGDRFLAVIDAAASSWHTLNIRLKLSNGKIISDQTRNFYVWCPHESPGSHQKKVKKGNGPATEPPLLGKYPVLTVP